MRKKINKLIAVILLLVVATTLKINAQNNSCATPNVLDTTQNNWDLTMTGTEYWVKFTATDNRMSIYINTVNNRPQANINSFYVYKGTCNNLQLIKQSNINTDSLNIFVDSLTKNNQYLIKICQPVAVSGGFNLRISRTAGWAYFGNDANPTYPTTSCNLIYNPSFTILGTNWYGYPQSGFPFFVNDNNLNYVKGWVPAAGSPEIKVYQNGSNANDKSAVMACNYIHDFTANQYYYTTEGIISKVKLIEGNTYKLSLKYRATERNENNPPLDLHIDKFYIELINEDFQWWTLQRNNTVPNAGPQRLPNTYDKIRLAEHIGGDNGQPLIDGQFKSKTIDFVFNGVNLTVPSGTSLNSYKYLLIYPLTKDHQNDIDRYFQIDDVELIPNETASITALNNDLDLCFGDNTELTANLTGNYALSGLTYQWYKDGTIITGATNRTYPVVNQILSGTHTFSCTITYANGCTASNNITINFATPPMVSTNPSGTFNICQGINTNVPMTANSNSNCNFYWYKSDVGGSILLQTTNNSLNSNYTATSPGNYYVQVISNVTGCQNTSSPVSIIFNQPYNPTIVANGPTTFYTGCSSKLKLQDPNPPSGLRYQWACDRGDIPGATNSTYTTNVTGSYYLKVTTAQNCSKESNWINVTVNPLPLPEIDGSIYACRTERYTITNYNIYPAGTISFSYSIDGGSNFIPITSSTFDITWYGIGHDILIKAQPNCGDAVINSFIVNDCCSNVNDVLDNLTINTPISINAGRYLVKGTLTINSLLTLQANAYFLFEANAQIIINEGGDLTCEGNNCFESCDKVNMWNGIIVNKGGGLILRGSIKDAKAAVTLNTGFIEGEMINIQFINNYKNIVINNIDYVRLSWQIARNTFSFDENHPLLSPYTGYNPVSGIEINNSQDVAIGTMCYHSDQNGYGCFDDNIFNKLNYGIVLNSSTAKLYGGQFNNLYNVSPIGGHKPFYDGSGILVTGKSLSNQNISIARGVNYDHHGLISGYGPSPTFTNCNYGITVFGTKDADIVIKDCFFADINNIGINAVNTNCMYLIKDNGINLNPDKYATGISINSNSPVIDNSSENETEYYKVDVENNTFYACRIGIDATNVGALSTHNNNIYFPNSIDFRRFYYGIRVNECQSANIENNYIRSYVAAQDEMQADQMQGINVTLSPFSRIADNQLITTGSGLYIAGDNRQLTIQCNAMSGNYNGVRLSKAFIGNQGIEEEAWNNSWLHINSNYFISGSIGEQINWYSLNSGDYFLPQFEIENSLTITAVEVSNGITCRSESSQSAPDSVLVSNPEERRELLGEVVNTSVPANVSTYSDESEYFKVKHTFDAIAKDTTILEMNVPEDANYIDFYNQTKATNIGKFKNVEKLVKAESVEEAKTLNLSVTAESNIDINSKIVNDIYLRTWAIDTMAISADDSAALYNIASQNPLSGGEAVYKARMMLNINFDDWIDDGTASLRQANTQPVIPAITTYIYNNGLNVKINLINRTVGYVEIYSLSGICLYKSEVSEGINNISLDKNSYAESVYFIKLLDANGNIIAVNKWVNIK